MSEAGPSGSVEHNSEGEGPEEEEEEEEEGDVSTTKNFADDESTPGYMLPCRNLTRSFLYLMRLVLITV